MLDLGWSEMAIIATVALLVIGPKDLPVALRTLGRYGGKVKALAREFQTSIDDAVKEAERDLHLEEVKKEVQAFKSLDMDTALNATEKLAAPEIKSEEGGENATDAEEQDSATSSVAPSVTANKHFVQVGASGSGVSRVSSEKADEAPATTAPLEEDAPEHSTLPLPTGVQQVAEAREKAEANLREDAATDDSKVDSVAEARRVEP